MTKEVTKPTDEGTVTLSDGRTIALRMPLAGELRGVKLLDVLQLDAAAHADLIPRISELTKPEIYQLGAGDIMALMTEVVGFFAPNEAAPSSYPEP